MEGVSQELLQAISNMIANAIQAAAGEPTISTSVSTRPPTFSMIEYKSGDESTVEDYFKRFSWALQLSKIPANEYANYVRVYMGSELLNALKFLVSPRSPEDLSFDEITNILIKHFDHSRNKYAESIKFRSIIQGENEPIADFALRLRKSATYCEYGNFLDRMLIEQLLHGLRSCEMCDEVIAKEPATFEEAYKITHELEATRKTTNKVTSSKQVAPEEINKLGYGAAQFKNKNKFISELDQDAFQNQSKLSCYGCGGSHKRSQCYFFDKNCRKCGKKGHIARVCRSKVQKTTSYINTSEQPTEQTVDNLDCIQNSDYFNVVNASNLSDRRMIKVNIDGRNLEMELDTGAPCTIISEKTFRSLKLNCSLRSSNRQFSSYTQHNIVCLGRLPVNVTIENKTRRLSLYVVKGDFGSLLGREWINHFAKEINFLQLFPDPEQVCSISLTASNNLSRDQQNRLNQVLRKHENAFGTKAGTLKGPPATLHLKPGTTPVFVKAREVPFALRDIYAKEIDAKLESGLYKRVEYSRWASTTHIVTKKNGKLRITGNYKPTLNPRMIVDEYPIPKPEHIFNQMKGAKLFCNLDITDAYSHLTIDEEFAEALTLNTPTHGLVRPTRAVYGAANIPAIWQRQMESVLQGLPNVRNFFDDIILFAEDFDRLLEIVDLTLQRLRSHGLKLNKDKCVFAATAVEFLGHRIDAEGIHKSDKFIQTIRDAPKPATLEELQLFLGKASYYNSLIPNLSTRSRPLRDMLVNKSFNWTPEVEESYQDIKNALISPQVLMPYDPSLPLILATDASSSGLGAVLSHQLEDGQERPIAYASRTMNSTEKKYPQIDKEALAIVWAVQKFFFYLYARHFTLYTDNKPLSQILHPEKSLPILCISRMANYADYLSHFNFDVKFKPTKLNANADYCSRVPLPFKVNSVNTSRNQAEETEYDSFDHFIINQVQQLPIRAEIIAREVAKDPHLGSILRLLHSGQDLRRNGFKSPEAEYKLASNCLVFEHRIVVPPKFRKDILRDLHAAHLGIVKMKALARSFVFWPGIDGDIEHLAKSCSECAKYAHAPPKFRDHHWEYPSGPWERIHIDYAGPFMGKMLFIVCDAYSKWLEVKIVNSSTTSSTTAILDQLFASYGVPKIIVSDNGSQFSSVEFKEFLEQSGVKFHKFTAPFHPSTNGQAERSVQTVKDHLKIMSTATGSLQSNLNQLLQHYRIAPHSTTGQSPAQLFLGRTLRTRFDLLKPESIKDKVMEKHVAKFEPSFRTFLPSQTIYFLSGNPRMDKWIPGTIISRLGDLHYEIDYFGKHVKRHVDQIRATQVQTSIYKKESPNSNGTNNFRRIRYSENRNQEPSNSYPASMQTSSMMNIPQKRISSSFTQTPTQSPMTETRTRPTISPPNSSLSDRSSISLNTPRRSSRIRRQPERYSP